jgi:hypothetical protein
MKNKQIKELLTRLEGPEGCNFRYEKGKGVWNCRQDFYYARKILRKMEIPKEERDALIKECKEHGGHCDCEILFNAEEHLLSKGKKTRK